MPAVTVIVLPRPDAKSEFARTVLSISAQRLRDWELRVVHRGDADLVAATQVLAQTDARIAGATDLDEALETSSAPVVCFCEIGARFPLDYTAAVVTAMADPQTGATVAARLIEHGPRFSRNTRLEPRGGRPAWSQVATRRESSALPIEQLLSSPGIRELPDVAVRTRFGNPPGPTDGCTVIAQISEATPPLSVKPQLAALREAGIPVVVTLVGPVRLPSRLALGKWLRESEIPAVAADSPAAARRAALTTIRTPVVTFLPAGWEVEPGAITSMADRLMSTGAAAVMPVARDAGGSILGAGLVWADRRTAPERLLQEHPDADIGGRVIDVPSPHPEGLTVRADDVLDADLPTPWWPVVALRERRGDVFLVDGDCHLSIPRFTPGAASGRGRRGRRLAPHALPQILAAGPPNAVEQSREVMDQLGFAVVGVETNGSGWRPIVSRTRTAPVAERRWALKIGAPPGQRGDPWGDVFFADDLAVALRSLGNDVVIDRDGSLGRGTAYLDRVVLNVRGYQVVPRQPGAVNLLWIISHPDDIPIDELRSFDRVYAASASWPKQAAKRSGVAIRSLLQATNPDRFHPGVAEPDTGPDLLFVGNSRHQFRPIVADCRAAGLQPTVIGRDWEQFLPSQEIAALSVPNADLPAAYRAAGIVLNDHWGDMVSHGFLNNRLFDAVACGARVVSDDVPGLAEVFGDAVAVYRTVDDLARLCDPANRNLLGTQEQLQARAAAVAADHSFLARARQLMADAAAVPILPV